MSDAVGIAMGIVTILAIILGPIIAVSITRFIDNRRVDEVHKMNIFRTLMQTRGIPIHRDHVGALNLVQVEFVNHPSVVEAWKIYFASLEEQAPPLEQKEQHAALAKKRTSLLTKLLSEIAKALNIKIEQLDILEENYVPQGWADDAWNEQLVRLNLIDVLTGRTPIKVHLYDPQQGSGLYPPPPKIQ